MIERKIIISKHDTFRPQPKPEKVLKPVYQLKKTKKVTGEKGLGVLKDIADGFFRVAIKKLDSLNGYIKCPTCIKTVPVKESECGHYVKRGENIVRWDERNAAAQCFDCNRFHDGRPFEFAKFIDKKYGNGTAAELKRLSKADFKLQRTDLEEIINKYKP